MSKFLETASAIGALVMAATPLLAVGSVVHAQTAAFSRARIEVAGLDFRSASDVATFRHRVSIAATSFCGQGDAGSLNASQTCRQAIYDEAVSKLGSAQQQDLRVSADRTGFTVATR